MAAARPQHRTEALSRLQKPLLESSETGRKEAYGGSAILINRVALPVFLPSFFVATFGAFYGAFYLAGIRAGLLQRRLL